MPARISLHRYFCDARVLLVICFFAATGAIASAKAWSEFYSPVAESASPSPATPAIKNASLSAVPSNGLQRELITIRPSGFEPSEITRPAGRFLLAVNDRSEQDEVVLLLTRENGEQLHRVRMRDTPRKHEWRQVVNLPPGRYVLAEAAHPEWTCRITLNN
jgi:hypothetical protein